MGGCRVMVSTILVLGIFLCSTCGLRSLVIRGGWCVRNGRTAYLIPLETDTIMAATADPSFNLARWLAHGN